MPKSSRTSKRGKELLKAEQDAVTKAIAEHTALVVAKYQALSFVDCELLESDSQESLEQSSSAPSGPNLWTRHNSNDSELLTFSRGLGETLTIRKAPGGNGWTIDYDEPVEDWPL